MVRKGSRVRVSFRAFDVGRRDPAGGAAGPFSLLIVPRPGSRRRSVLAALVVVAVSAVIVAPGAAAASGSDGGAFGAAREALVLSRERLGLMKEVMASKWLSRAPIQDLAQEEAVKESAIAQGLELGVAAGATRGLFTAEIAAAKEVQLGWGSHWLFDGAPAGLAAPDLGQLRTTLGRISERLVALLPKLVGLGSEPNAEARLRAAAAKSLRVPYLGPTGRSAIVEALLGVRVRRTAG
jgi:chorismate mutase